MKSDNLKDLLENSFKNYRKKFSSKDPVWLLHSFSDEKDIELMGLVTSAYSYGRVDIINMFIEKLLKKIGNRPYEFTLNFEKSKDKKLLSGLRYRFSTEDDLANLFHSLRCVLTEHSSLKDLFLKGYEKSSVNITAALKKFMSVLGGNSGGKYGRPLGFLLPDPSGGSTCKRMNLFLRWMIRKDEIDPGIWDGIDRSKLIMPVDTHVARISRILGLVNRHTVDMKFAVELTERLKEFDPEDPVKYDFALCHFGIDGKLPRITLKSTSK